MAREDISSIIVRPVRDPLQDLNRHELYRASATARPTAPAAQLRSRSISMPMWPVVLWSVMMMLLSEMSRCRHLDSDP